MKKLWKAFAVCCAIAMLGSAFTACKSDDDDDDGDKKPVETTVSNGQTVGSYEAPIFAGDFYPANESLYPHGKSIQMYIHSDFLQTSQNYIQK